jgi:hypothetical protein
MSTTIFTWLPQPCHPKSYPMNRRLNQANHKVRAHISLENYEKCLAGLMKSFTLTGPSFSVIFTD